MPAGGFQPPPLDQYLKALVMSLNADRVAVGDRIERRVLYGPTSGFPDARGGGDLYYDTTVGDLYIDTGTWDLVFSSVPAHTHDDRYYTETELDGGQLDNRYYTESEVDALLHAESHTIASHSDTSATGAELNELTDSSETTLHSHAVASHTIASHSDTSATGAELNTLTNGSTSVTLHYHDSRYYTEGEVDTLLGSYLPLSAGSGEQLTDSLYLAYSASGRGIIAKGSVGQNHSLIGLNVSEEIQLGDASRDMQVLGGTFVKFQGVYLDLNANQLIMGGGLIDSEGGVIQSGGADIKTENGDFLSGTGDFIGGVGAKLTINTLDFCQLVSGQRIFGYTTDTTWLEGANLRLYGPYKTGTADPPTTTQFDTANAWGCYRNTSNGKVWLGFNSGGTLKLVELT
jgi:hypothetical protein